MNRASRSLYFLLYFLISFSLMSYSSEAEAQTVYVTKTGKKHFKCSHFRYLKTKKSIVDISDINVIGIRDLGLYKCCVSCKKKPVAQIAHLVLPSHMQTLKNQKSYFFANALK